MTIGTSMGQEICLILGQVSLSLLYWKRNLQTYICGPGKTEKRAVKIQARSFMARALDKIGKKCRAEGEAQNGPMKNRNSIMPEDYEEFISLTLRTRNSRKPSRMLARNWKRRWLLLCLARQARHVSMVRPWQNQ